MAPGWLALCFVNYDLFVKAMMCLINTVVMLGVLYVLHIYVVCFTGNECL